MTQLYLKYILAVIVLCLLNPGIAQFTPQVSAGIKYQHVYTYPKVPVIECDLHMDCPPLTHRQCRRGELCKYFVGVRAALQPGRCIQGANPFCALGLVSRTSRCERRGECAECLQDSHCQDTGQECRNYRCSRA